MKYYQCKNEEKYFYPFICIFILFFGFFALCSFEIIDFGTEATLFSGISFSLWALLGIVILFYTVISKKYERTVKLTEEGILYQGKKRSAEIKWHNVESVALESRNIWLPYSRLVYVTARGFFPLKSKGRVSHKRIWSEYNDEMLEEIKKYWHGNIENEDLYLKWKAKKENRNNTRNSDK